MLEYIYKFGYIFKLARNILVGIICMFIVCFCANKYEASWSMSPTDKFDNFWLIDNILNVAVYAMMFVFFPILIGILFWKNYEVKWYICICVIFILIFTPYAYYYNLTMVETDFETYLKENSAFEINAASVMPEVNELSDKKIVFFEETKSANDFYHGIRLSVIYPEKDFQAEVQRLNTIYLENTLSSYQPDKNDFYFDGVFYHCFTFFNECDYAMAYHICSDSNAISYFFFKSFELQTMTAGQIVEFLD